jgi:hypothetical protein
LDSISITFERKVRRLQQKKVFKTWSVNYISQVAP